MRRTLSKRRIFGQCEKAIHRLFAIVVVERILIIVIHVCLLFLHFVSAFFLLIST